MLMSAHDLHPGILLTVSLTTMGVMCLAMYDGPPGMNKSEIGGLMELLLDYDLLSSLEKSPTSSMG